ncbi:MAG: Undecaprenyl-phosphate mannosyltransferase [candidate division BRC1 bacterium ADurb.BinA292]|nr:MAG: Undecaprenyl-phosphate mannosyltransferase [candidate division BRC1 bacterium ADurb.BinA292]
MPEPIRSICLTLPAYNEEAAIEPLLIRAEQALRPEPLEWSVIVVDDGSRDATAAIVERLAAARPWLRLVRHDRNRGLGPAILTGIQSALEGPWAADRLIVCMDADMTHPPETIPLMRARADATGADVVIASRYQPGSRQHGVPLFRRTLSFGARLLFRHYLALPGVRDYTCGFRAMRASLLRRALARFGPEGLITRTGFACTDELLVHLAMVGARIEEVPFILRYDLKQGASKMNLGLTVRETLKLLRSHRTQLRAGRDGG